MPEGIGWVSETLSDQGAEAFFKASRDRQAETERLSKSNKTQGIIVCVGFACVGIIGMLSCLTVLIKTPIAREPPWVVIDRNTGVIDHPVTARDAPRYFSEATRKSAIRDFIVNCESYVPQTWAKIDWHACMVMATPDEQKRRGEDIGKGGPRYPPAIFGPDGWAKPTAFPDFQLLGSVGDDPDKVYRYRVRYERTEVISGREFRPRYTADITLTFRPDMKISDADRLLNETGTQTMSFSTVKD